jgi:hypothetical protein
LDSEEIADRVGCERHAVGLWLIFDSQKLHLLD